MKVHSVGLVGLFFLQGVLVNCETYSTAKTVVETISNFYYNNGKSLTRIIPLEDLSQPIGLTLTMAIYSIDRFDAVTGQVEITGSLFQEWTDATKSSSIGNFNFSSFQEGYSVLISPGSIWTPTVVLLNAVDTIEKVGDPAYKVRYQVSEGRAKWQPRTLLKASCKPDVRYYPFDRQECSFTYTPWGYTSGEVYVEQAQSDWYLCDYTPNGIWTLIETKADTEMKNGADQLTFTFKIERRPLFFVINVVLPVLLLGFVNGFVFLMPPDCGERIGFSVTCFLTLVFMLQTVLNFLPHAAEPMSIFCFYMVVMMIMSISVAILTIIVLRLHHRKDKASVPRAVKTFVRFVTFVECKAYCKRCIKKMQIAASGRPSSGEGLVIDSGRFSTSGTRRRTVSSKPLPGKEYFEESRDTDSCAIEDHQDVEWPDISRVLDFFFFILFIVTQISLAVVFLVPLATGVK